MFVETRTGRALLSVLLALTAATALAQLRGPQIEVNGTTSGFQLTPQVARLGQGGFVVIWISEGQDGSDSGIFGRRFDAEGVPLGGEFQVNTYTTNRQDWPQVASNSAGDFIVVWQSQGQDGSDDGVFAQRFDDQGTPLGSEFRVNSSTSNSQGVPAIASLASDGFVVVWESWTPAGPDSDLFGQRLTSTGAPVGSEFQVNSYTPSYQSSAAVEGTIDDGFIVVWNQLGDGSGTGIVGQSFDATNTMVGTPVEINTTTLHYQQIPRIERVASGAFFVVWTSWGQDGSLGSVAGRPLSSSGAPLGGEFLVNRDAGLDQNSPTLTAEESGGVLVAWADQGLNGVYQKVSAQRLDAQGLPRGSQFAVSVPAGGNNRMPAVASIGADRLVAAWMSLEPEPAEWEIRGQLLQAPMFLDGFELGDTCAWSARDGSGEVCPP